MELIVQREIAASPERTWGVITDLERFADVLSGVERIERLDGGSGFGVGTRWSETRTMFGKQATEEMEVASLEPGHSYTTVSENGGTTYTSTVRVAPVADDRCELSMSFAATSAGTLGRLLGATIGRAFLGATRKMLHRDLEDIAAASETAPDGT